MNELGIALVWAAVQATAVASAGLGLSGLAARRGPGAGSAAAATALAAAAALAVLACCPLPRWWAWDFDRPAAPVAAAETEAPIASAGDKALSSAGESARGGAPLSGVWSTLRPLVHAPGPRTVDEPGPVWTWPAIAAAAILAGAALGLLRLLLGLWAVHDCRRRSRAVDDPSLLALVEELRPALGCRRGVAVRETDHLATAATAGWRRPVLLLPADWPEWTDGQLRAVVAHELAHVGRGDYAAWLLARVGVALHWFHPLVRRLAARLQLQQELAADALAARFAGGRAVYLKALASLALRSGGRPVGWAAPTFLSPRGTLLRRIAMLRVTDDTPGRPTRRRWLTAALVLAVAAAASALRGPAHSAEPPAAAAPAPAATDGRPPLDVSNVVFPGMKNEVGVFAIRPSAIFSRPELKPVAALYNLSFKVEFQGFLGVPDALTLRIEEIDQIAGRVVIGDGPPGKRTLMMSLTSVRATHDFDWAKLLRTWWPKLEERKHEGQVYYQAPKDSPVANMLGGGFFYVPDGRTLVCDSDANIHRLIEVRAGKTPPTPAAWAGEWKHVERALCAAALDNRGQGLLKRSLTEQELKDAAANPKSPEGLSARILQHSELIALGLGDRGEDGCWVLAHFTHNGDADRAELDRARGELVEFAAAATRDCSADPKATDSDKKFVRWQEGLAASAAAKHGERSTEIRFEAEGVKKLLSECVTVGVGVKHD